MCQGTALFTPALETVLRSPVKPLVGPPSFRPDDPMLAFVEQPELFIGPIGRPVPPHPRRVPLDRAGWLAAHGRAAADFVIDLENVRLIVLDTNHPDGDYQGSIGVAQLAWLDEALRGVGAGRVAVVASHHGTRALVNERGLRNDRLHGDALLAVLQRHRCLAAWLIGHGHRNRIARHAGFPEIMTASIIDWPSEHRLVEIWRTATGDIEVATTVRSPEVPDGSLAALHRALAHRFEGAAAAAARRGRPDDRNVRLALG